MPPAGQLRADGGGQHRSDSRRALQRHSGGHASWYVAPKQTAAQTKEDVDTKE